MRIVSELVARINIKREIMISFNLVKIHFRFTISRFYFAFLRFCYRLTVGLTFISGIVNNQIYISHFHEEKKINNNQRKKWVCTDSWKGKYRIKKKIKKECTQFGIEVCTGYNLCIISGYSRVDFFLKTWLATSNMKKASFELLMQISDHGMNWDG